MLSRQINLTWLRTFEAASRTLNFTQTAAELGLTQAAVSLHIRSLEDRLGCKLFHRRARHLSLTEIGQAYVPSVQQAFSDLNIATLSLFGPSTRHMITIKAPVSTATLWLAPNLQNFRTEHPNIDLRLVSNIWTDTTDVEGVDIELRFGRGDWSDAPSEKLADEFIVPICRKNTPSIPSAHDLQKGPLIHILGQQADWDRYWAAHDLTPPTDVSEYYVDTTNAAIELVASGGGYSVVMQRLVQAANMTQARVTIAGDPIPLPNAYYLMQPRTKRAKRPVVDLFENWLRTQFT